MLSIHKLHHLSAKWDVLQENRPSIIRNSIVYWFFRIVFNLIAIGAVILFIITFSREMWLPLFEGEITEEDYQIIDQILIAYRVTAIVIFAISVIIVWLSKGASRRNGYIMQIEDIIEEYKKVSDEEYRANPNNRGGFQSS